MTAAPGKETEVDVLVVGAGPGGSATAYQLARRGVDVLLIDKAQFPREKVCGDGFTPRGVREMIEIGIDPTEPGFYRTEGLRVYRDHDMVLEMKWPKLHDFPDYGVVRTRNDFDDLCAQQAVKAGAQLWQQTEALEPVIDDDGWVAGAKVKQAESEDGEEPHTIRARVVIAADGASSRFASHAGVKRDPSKPLAIAARRYYRMNRDLGPWLESWVDIWDGDDMLPAYGWLFPVGDGTVNVGCGLLNTYDRFKNVSAHKIFDLFVEQLPPEWGVDEDHAEGKFLSGPIPMGINRTPVAMPGLLLIGDAAGIVNPFNAEGIAYAMESGRMAANLVADSLTAGKPALAQMYPTLLKEQYGQYFSIASTWARWIGNPKFMHFGTKHGLHRKWLMKFALRLMSNLTDGPQGGTQDKLIYALEKLGKAS